MAGKSFVIASNFSQSYIRIQQIKFLKTVCVMCALYRPKIGWTLLVHVPNMLQRSFFVAMCVKTLKKFIFCFIYYKINDKPSHIKNTIIQFRLAKKHFFAEGSINTWKWSSMYLDVFT
jgi:hypothetical protein